MPAGSASSVSSKRSPRPGSRPVSPKSPKKRKHPGASSDNADTGAEFIIQPQCRTLQKANSMFRSLIVSAVEEAGDDLLRLDVAEVVSTVEQRRNNAAVRRQWRAAFREVMRSTEQVARKVELLEIIGGAAGFSPAHLADEISIDEELEALPRNAPHVSAAEQQALRECIVGMFTHMLP